MKKASIISIGNEILSGQTVDTNASYLSERLFSAGIPVTSSYTVGDDVAPIVRAFSLASDDADVVITTGGLGPTDDDSTRQGFAKFLGTELLLDNELLERIEDFFTRRDLPMPARNRVQAFMPGGARALLNNLGTAPGIMAEAKGKLFFALPGVPAEMKRMFKESVFEKLTALSSRQSIVVRKLKCFGAGESTISQLLGKLMQRGRNPLINCTAECGTITLHIIAIAEDKNRAQEMVQKDEKSLRDILGELIYGTGEQTLAEVVGQRLGEQEKTIAAAESCTGGTLARLITDVPGASRYFTCGWVTYSNEAKTGELGVPAELLGKYGAVSDQVAEAMAQCARKRAGTDFAIGITGIAGPTGGTEQKPVGLVYVCVASESGCDTQRFIFSQDRGSVRLRAALTALNMLRLRLEN